MNHRSSGSFSLLGDDSHYPGTRMSSLDCCLDKSHDTVLYPLPLLTHFCLISCLQCGRPTEWVTVSLAHLPLPMMGLVRDLRHNFVWCYKRERVTGSSESLFFPTWEQCSRRKVPFALLWKECVKPAASLTLQRQTMLIQWIRWNKRKGKPWFLETAHLKFTDTRNTWSYSFNCWLST